MNGTVIDNPKDTTSIVIGWPRHDLFDQPTERCNSVLGFTPAENSGMVDVQSAEVNPGSAALVAILDASRTTRFARLSGMEAPAGLDAGLLIRRDHEFISF